VLHVVGEQVVRVHHNLLARPGTRIEDVRRVYSHPQALAQCQAFLRKHRFEAVTDFDTAGAAKLLAENGGEGKAALASKRAAEAYGLEVLAENVEDLAFNYTRFFVLGADAAPRPTAAEDQPGARHAPPPRRPRRLPGRVPQARHQHDEARVAPAPRQAVELPLLHRHRGPRRGPHVAGALTGLMRKAAFVKFLGSYPAAPALVELD
jgi:prephenate dehydratase